MFSSALDKIDYPLSTRSWGVVLGCVIMVAVAAALVSGKTVPFSFGAIVASFLVAARARGKLNRALPQPRSVSLHSGIFLLYAVASAAWADEPGNTLLTVFLAILVAVGTIMLVQLIAEESYPNLLHMGEGLWIGLLVGVAYLLAEILTHQSIKIWLYNAIGIKQGGAYFGWSEGKLISISLDDLKHSIAPVSLFLWPAVMALQATLARRWRIFGSAVLVALVGVVVFLSSHGTSKPAYAIGLVTFGCAFAAPRLTARLVAIGWVCLCLAVLPAVLAMHRVNLHNATWLQPSARHRIIIWNYTAEQVLKAPLLGVGADMTFILGPRLEPHVITAPDEAYTRTLNRHAHSIYLQTWFELGLIGAALLTLLGLSILQAIGSFALPMQPYAYATFVSAAALAASSYGMWQIWFMAMVGLSAALVGLSRGLVLKGNSRNAPGARSMLGASCNHL